MNSSFSRRRASEAQIAGALNQHGDVSADDLRQIRVRKIKVSPSDREKVKASLARDSRFNFVEINAIAAPQLTPNDASYECPLKPGLLVEMLKLIDNGTLSGKMAKSVFEAMYGTDKSPESIVREKGLVQISDSGEIEKAVDDIIARHQKEAERFRAGEEKLMGFFVGQIMKVTKGKANPQIVNELLKKKLS